MADARALLRAHRAENRIKHPHAAYSDAGKLLCKLCHEPVKTEALWDSHIRGPDHKKRLQVLQSDQPSSTTDRSRGTSKRKHDDVYESKSDADGDGAEDSIRKKRSKPDMGPATTTGSNGGEKRQTPPLLGRRTSSTPVQGVEIAIPSRPATPAAGSSSATSTPKAAPVGRSPLIGSETTNTPTSTSTPTTQSNLPISTQSLSTQAPTATAGTASTTTHTQSATQASATAIDEAEWAAFEAATADDPAYPADATISAPALSAAQLAAKSQEEENERRGHNSLLDAQIADEREDATRALEAEFEEMEELETRVRRLKERREALRKGSLMNLRGAAKRGEGEQDDVVMAKSPVRPASGKENCEAVIDEEDEEDEEDEDEDDWDAFRFR